MQFRTYSIPVIGLISLACTAIACPLFAQERASLTVAMELADQEERQLSFQNQEQYTLSPAEEIGLGQPEGLSNPYALNSGNRFHRLGVFPDKLGFFHSDPDDPGRYSGEGAPLFGTSWRNRPYHADIFFGSLLTGDLEKGSIFQRSTAISGVRLGYDFDHYWGAEIRLAKADARVNYASDRTLAGTSSILMVDTTMKYYPWGDSQWRPFATLGMGYASFDYLDATGLARNQSLVNIPIGVGMKYYLRPWFIFRTEMQDNMTIGASGMSSMHNLSFTGGFEYRFGGPRPSYTR
ncbi:MAG: hypothetical protein COA78_18915 [Blastopirellula sp.]|nr:MAG: hypothetical protein COA78_18915 [Blastopirellula sp.]